MAFPMGDSKTCFISINNYSFGKDVAVSLKGVYPRSLQLPVWGLYSLVPEGSFELSCGVDLAMPIVEYWMTNDQLSISGDPQFLSEMVRAPGEIVPTITVTPYVWVASGTQKIGLQSENDPNVKVSCSLDGKNFTSLESGIVAWLAW